MEFSQWENFPDYAYSEEIQNVQNGKNLQINNIAEWRMYVIHNTSVYGRNVINFCQVWANRMEQIMAEAVCKLDLFIIKESFHYAYNRKTVGPNQAKAAAEMLVAVWEFGPKLEELFMEINDEFNPYEWVRTNA